MTTSILLVTHARDLRYAEWCVASILKFSEGFSGLTIVCPNSEKGEFSQLANYGDAKLVGHDLVGHLGAQTQKCFADQHCNSDFVLHLDSDTIFTSDVSPSDYFVDGKPVMLIEEYSRLIGCPWKEHTDRALGIDAKFETMRRHPQVNPVGLYPAMRARVAEVHGKAFESYMMAQKADFPWGASEHNFLGAFALWHPDWSGKYHWIDVAKDQRPKDKLYQAWSHSPPEVPQDLPSGGRGTPLELYQRLGL